VPRHSPEPNWAERLFEEVRRQVAGRAYATLADTVAAVDAFLDELDADPARVRRLRGRDWIDAAIATLPASRNKVAEPGEPGSIGASRVGTGRPAPSSRFPLALARERPWG